MGFSAPTSAAPVPSRRKKKTLADLPEPTAPKAPSAVNASPYNPMTAPFQQFRMAPYLVGMSTQTAGRPSLVRGRA